MANINELLEGHVTLEVECIDRLYLNGYLPSLATGGALVGFLTQHLGKPIPSPALLGQITEAWVAAVKNMAAQQGIPVVHFQHGERKDEVANRLRQQRGVRDQVVFIGVAQEKAQTFSARKEGSTFHYDRDKTVYVNHYYFYLDDEDFGPIFLKVCSYAPWSLKLCLNGHEWAKRQLEKQGITFETLDNGFRSCADPKKLQETCDRLGPEDIERLFRKWLRRLPLPLSRQDREAGYDWQLSIWQMEVSLTQIFDRPQKGREFFEEVMRDNLDLGRPDRLQLIFERRGRHINRRLLEVERVSHNCGLSGDSIYRVVQPTVNEDGQKAPGLKFGDPRVMALWVALSLFTHLIQGFRHRDLRRHVADLLGVESSAYSAAQMTYDLRRLRLKGLIYR